MSLLHHLNGVRFMRAESGNGVICPIAGSVTSPIGFDKVNPAMSSPPVYSQDTSHKAHDASGNITHPLIP